MKLYLKYTLPLIYSILSLTTLQAELIRIMPLGDSITYDDKLSDHAGTPRPSSIRTAYRSHLHYMLTEASYPVDFVGSRVAGEQITPPFDPHNEGHPGWTSDDIASNVYNFLTRNPADIILLHIGTNDNDTSVADVNNILNEIDLYEAHTGSFVRVIIALIIDRQDQDDLYIAGFNHNLDILVNKRIQRGDALTLVNMYRGAGLTSDDYDDHTHPNDQGYKKMAQVWFNALMAPYNIELHKFPSTLVTRSYIESVSVNETEKTVTFVTNVPNIGITF